MSSNPRGGVAWEKWFSRISWLGFWLVTFWTLGHTIHCRWPWDSRLWAKVAIFASSSLSPLCLFSPCQEQLKSVPPGKHSKVLGVRWSFQFKTLLYSKPDCFLLVFMGFFTFHIYPYSGREEGELKEMDKTVLWASPHIYYPLQIESWSLVRSVISPTEQALSGYRK